MLRIVWITAVLFGSLAIGGQIFAADTVAAGATKADIDKWVQLYNPDLLAGHKAQGLFTGPASDLAIKVRANAWFSTLVFLPFLILPQVLLLVVMFKFKDRNDGRKPATFMANHKLEIAWTAIPILALIIVGIPCYPLMWEMDLPPKDAKDPLLLTVRAKQFAWDYEYKHEAVKIGQDVAGMQEAVMLVKDRAVVLYITSNDVNHAWWIPAFGVKKDALIGRFNHCWFTPIQSGFFKGQCAELCGQGHGIMLISAVVLDSQSEFDRYIAMQRHRDDTLKVWNAVEPAAGTNYSAAVLQTAVAKYLEKDNSTGRRDALRFWIASNYASAQRKPPNGATVTQIDQFKTQAGQRCAALDAALAKVAMNEHAERAEQVPLASVSVSGQEHQP